MEEKIKQTNPTLHRYLFTVTTFSKLLAMALFILLPFFGFYLGMKYQEKTIVNTPTASMDNKTITLTPTPTANHNANKDIKNTSNEWINYKSEFFNLSIKIPPG